MYTKRERSFNTVEILTHPVTRVEPYVRGKCEDPKCAVEGGAPADIKSGKNIRCARCQLNLISLSS